MEMENLKEQLQSTPTSEYEIFLKETTNNFNSWRTKHKATFEAAKVPSRYCIGSDDVVIFTEYMIAQLGYTPSKEALEALFDVISASFVYGFRRGCNYTKKSK